MPGTAKLVVGVEGSHLIHAMVTIAEGGTLLVLQPPNRFNNPLKDYTDCLGMNYAFLTGHAVEDGFEVDLDQLARLLEQIDRFVR